MKNLRSSNFILCCLFLSSCIGFSPRLKAVKNSSNSSSVSAVLSDTITTKYSAKIKFFNKQFTGLFVVKNISKSHHRVVFLSETGMKYFDFEFKQNEFINHYCFEPLNSDRIINVFKNDFLLLFENVNDKDIIKQYMYRKTLVLRKEMTPLKNYFFTDSLGLIKKIIQTNGLRNSVKVNVEKSANTTPQKIAIKHLKIKLKITLERI